MRVKVSKGKTIAEVVKDGLCTGCGTCVGTCPVDASEMVIEHKRGIYIPQLDEGKCNQCGLCFEVCPGHAVDFKQLNLEIFGKEPEDVLLGNYINCYAGHATDYDIRYNSSSGGLVTALLIYALEQGMIDGALVTRMKKDKPLEPEPFIARTGEDIISAARSKYCPVPANIALKEILKAKERERFAIVGLPCHIHGIRKAETASKRLKEKIVLHLGLFCSGTLNFRATEFLFRRRKVASENIKALHYRGEGWPGNMSLHLKDDRVKVIPYPVYWDGFGGLFFPPKCKACLDWYSSLSDISFGDAWLPEVKKIDKVGTSIIISRTKQAENVLQQMLHEKRIELHAISAGSVLESQKGFSRKKKQLKVRLTVAGLFRRKMLAGNYQHLGHPAFYDYLVSVLSFSGTNLASKRSLWWLLDIYCFLLKAGSSVKSRLKLCLC